MSDPDTDYAFDVTNLPLREYGLDDTRFPCPCGDEHCIGDSDDSMNIKLGATWYAADCAMANAHPIVVEDREHDARHAERAGK